MAWFHGPGLCRIYYLGPWNKVKISVYYSFIHTDIWKFGWNYTPGTIHSTDYSSQYPLLIPVFIHWKILLVTRLSLETPTLFMIRTGISFFSFSKKYHEGKIVGTWQVLHLTWYTTMQLNNGLVNSKHVFVIKDLRIPRSIWGRRGGWQEILAEWYPAIVNSSVFFHQSQWYDEATVLVNPATCQVSRIRMD